MLAFVGDAHAEAAYVGIPHLIACPTFAALSDLSFLSVSLTLSAINCLSGQLLGNRCPALI